MKFLIVLAALVAVSSAGYLAAPLVATSLHPVTTSRFSRSDWSQPTVVNIPAVQEYKVVHPGATTYHQPLVAAYAAPAHYAAPAYYGAHYAAPAHFAGAYGAPAHYGGHYAGY